MGDINRNKIPKPNMNEFFVRGVPLAEAVALRNRWHLLSPEELEALGFTDPSKDSESYAQSHVNPGISWLH
jgi:hypothetical protein